MTMEGTEGTLWIGFFCASESCKNLWKDDIVESAESLGFVKN